MASAGENVTGSSSRSVVPFMRLLLPILLSGAFGSALTLFIVLPSSQNLSTPCPKNSLFIDPQLHNVYIPTKQECPVCRCDCARWHGFRSSTTSSEEAEAKTEVIDKIGVGGENGKKKESEISVLALKDEDSEAQGYQKLVLDEGKGSKKGRGKEKAVSGGGESGRKTRRRIAINYADRCCQKQQVQNCKSALEFGADECRMYSLHALDMEFIKANRVTLSQRKGAGFWLWKPYVILRSLMELKEGDILLYSDAKVKFIKPLKPLFGLAEEQDVVPFNGMMQEGEGTKRDAFVLMMCDEDMFVKSRQRTARYIVFKKSMRSIQFVAKWLEFSMNPSILTDKPNESGLPDYALFRGHHYDQSIFSLLTKKWGLKAWPDAGEWGEDDRIMEGVSWSQLLKYSKGGKNETQ